MRDGRVVGSSNMVTPARFRKPFTVPYICAACADAQISSARAMSQEISLGLDLGWIISA